MIQMSIGNLAETEGLLFQEMPKETNFYHSFRNIEMYNFCLGVFRDASDYVKSEILT